MTTYYNAFSNVEEFISMNKLAIQNKLFQT
jgi:hypothetical protein